jgi:hypothetical protein
MNLLIDVETPDAPHESPTRSTLVSGLMLHAVLFTAILSVQVGMVAQAVTPHMAPVILND